ncbi:MAG TPA: cation:proton antiporter [Terriglobales bacterium]|nr:cation:proton antiporter [Terriglobales bacterium]
MALLLIFAVTLMLAVLISALAQRTVLSTTVLFLAAGLLAGRGVFGPLPALPAGFLRTVAELALFSVLFTDGMRAGGEPAPARTRGLVVRALALAMPLTIVGIAAAAHWMLGMSWPAGLLIGAVLSPTDPIFISAIFRFKAVPYRLQRLLNVESGINDGIALPLVIIFLGELAAQPASLGLVVLELAAGVGLGIVIPWIGIKLESSRYFGAAGALQPLNAFALGLLVLALAWPTGANIFLAAFAAGVTVARLSPEARHSFEGFGEGITELLKLAAILIFGLELAPNLFLPLSWAEVVFILLALAVVRMAAMEISLLGSVLTRAERWTVGWFGPKGFGSVVYGLMILELATPLAQRLAHLAGLTIMLSIVVYSSTDILVARGFERRSHGRGDGDGIHGRGA